MSAATEKASIIAKTIIGRVRKYLDDVLPRMVVLAVDERVKALPAPEPGRPGKDADVEALKALVREEALAQSIAQGAELRSTIPDRIAEAVSQAMAQIPRAKDGDPGKDADMAAVAAAITEAVAGTEQRLLAQLRSEIVAEMREALAIAVAALPEPKNGQPGKDADMPAVESLIAKHVTEAVAAIPAPKDGVSVTGGMVDRDGDLVLTLSTGENVKVGHVVGKDAEPAQPGAPGRDGIATRDELHELLKTAVAAAVPAAVEASVAAEFERRPQLEWKGVWQEGVSYRRGNNVTWGGSLWIAVEDTSEKPETGQAWKLAVKRGRDANSSRKT